MVGLEGFEPPTHGLGNEVPFEPSFLSTVSLSLPTDPFRTPSFRFSLGTDKGVQQEQS